jgi:hypothetical protein
VQVEEAQGDALERPDCGEMGAADLLFPCEAQQAADHLLAGAEYQDEGLFAAAVDDL